MATGAGLPLTIGEGEDAVTFGRGGLIYHYVDYEARPRVREFKYNDGESKKEVFGDLPPVVIFGGILSIRETPSAYDTLKNKLPALEGTIQLVTFQPNRLYNVPNAMYNVENIKWRDRDIILIDGKLAAQSVEWTVRLTFNSLISETSVDTGAVQ